MTGNTKGSGHIGCSCASCRLGINAQIRAAKERAARHAWKIQTKMAIREGQEDELIISKGKTGYTD